MRGGAYQRMCVDRLTDSATVYWVEIPGEGRFKDTSWGFRAPGMAEEGAEEIREAMKARATWKGSGGASEREDAVLDSGTLRDTLQKMTTIELRLYLRSVLMARKLPKERTRYQSLLNEIRAEFRRRLSAGSRGRITARDAGV